MRPRSGWLRRKKKNLWQLLTSLFILNSNLQSIQLYIFTWFLKTTYFLNLSFSVQLIPYWLVTISIEILLFSLRKRWADGLTTKAQFWGSLSPRKHQHHLCYEHGSDGEGNISSVLLMEVACHYQYFLLFRDSGHCQFSLFLLLSFQFQVRVGMCYLKSTVWIAGGVTHKQV